MFRSKGERRAIGRAVMVAAPWHKLAVPTNEAVEFLGVFARFEFALKYAGYRGRSANNAVTANWDTFAATVRAQFNKAATAQLAAAVDYLIQHPPKRQEVDPTGALVFAVVQHDQTKTELEQALICVRRVRNNLFHGGKIHSGGRSEPRPEAREQLHVAAGRRATARRQCSKRLRQWLTRLHREAKPELSLI